VSLKKGRELSSTLLDLDVLICSDPRSRTSDSRGRLRIDLVFFTQRVVRNLWVSSELFATKVVMLEASP